MSHQPPLFCLFASITRSSTLTTELDVHVRSTLLPVKELVGRGRDAVTRDQSAMVAGQDRISKELETIRELQGEAAKTA